MFLKPHLTRVDRYILANWMNVHQNDVFFFQNYFSNHRFQFCFWMMFTTNRKLMESPKGETFFHLDWSDSFLPEVIIPKTPEENFSQKPKARVGYYRRNKIPEWIDHLKLNWENCYKVVMNTTGLITLYRISQMKERTRKRRRRIYTKPLITR